MLGYELANSIRCFICFQMKQDKEETRKKQESNLIESHVLCCYLIIIIDRFRMQ